MPIENFLKISSKASIDKLILAISNGEENIDELMQFAYDERKDNSWRAVWAISHLAEKHPKLVKNYCQEIILKLPSFQSERHIGSFIHTLIKLNPEVDEIGLLFDVCIEQLKKEKLSMYVKYYALQMLEKICIKETELIDEFLLVLDEIEKFIEVKHIRKNIQQIRSKCKNTERG
jgi:hypothetical protein